MAEPRLLQVGTEETIETVKGESGLSSAQVGTEAKVSVASEESAKGVYVADTNVVSDNSRTLKVSKDRPAGVYEQNIKQAEGFERSKGEKKIVDTITVDETKFLIKKSQKETKEYVDSLIELIREGQYVVVDTETYPTLEQFLASTGEQGTVYLYPLDNAGNNYDQYIWENGVWKNLGSTELDLSNYVDLDSAQTITGVKTFTNGIVTGSINAVGPLTFKRNGTGKVVIASSSIRPDSNNDFDIGESSYKYRNIYLGSGFNPNASGYNLTLPDTTSFTASKYIATTDQTFNVIDASDIVNNTLTQAQYDLIRNGKPTWIKGKLSNLNDIMLFSGILSDANVLRGNFTAHNQYGQSYFGTYLIATNLSITFQKTFYTDPNGRVTITNLNNVNNKTLPGYPTTNTSPQYLQIGASGGDLSYNDPFNPASVSLSDGGTISDTTLQANIQFHRPITLNGYTGYFSCDDGTNYQYTNTMFDSSTNSIHINVITINKSTWVVTFHTSDLTLN